MAANKRLIKKEIRRICGALAGECVITKITVPGVDPEAINRIIYHLAELQESAIRLVSISFPQTTAAFGSKKEYADARHRYYAASFAKLRDSFNTRVAEILKDMNAVLPAAQKEANRQAIAAGK